MTRADNSECARQRRYQRQTFQISTTSGEPQVVNTTQPSPVPTLYEWIGGLEPLERLFATFYQRIPADPVLGAVFVHMSPAHAQTVARFVAEVLGGPTLYSGSGQHGHSTMIAKHLNRHLSDDQRKQWVRLLLDTADDLKLPSDPEFRSALVGYLEWGSRLAVINSQTADNPIDAAAPMPTWGWGEVKGPYALK